MMRIVITGTPGTGKTSVARALGEKLGIPTVSDKELARRSVVDLRSLRAKAWWVCKKKDAVILEGHLFCEVKLPVDVVIVLRTDPRVLLERLKQRGYPEKKVRDNIVAEIVDYCLTKAEERYSDVWEVDTTHKSAEKTADAIAKALEHGEKIVERRDWAAAAEELIKKGYI